MNRPTLTELRERVHGAPPPKNTTEPCGTCADADGALVYRNGDVRVICRIPRDRAKLYPMLRLLQMPAESVMPCWRAK